MTVQKTKVIMEYKHFSHQHALNLTRVQAGANIECNGCHLPCNDDSVFACWSCNFFLHEHCGNAKRYVKHPSHTLHPLILQPSPTYCSGSFLCNCCGRSGSSFSYSCAPCEIDLHVKCAYLPPNLSHRAHQHGLHLTFSYPENPRQPDYCGICRNEVSSTHWSYSCEKQECEFRVHTSCATTELKPEMYQDDQQEQIIPVSAATPTDQNTGEQSQVRMEQGLTPEEEIALEINRMRMEFQLAQALGNIIAYYPN